MTFVYRASGRGSVTQPWVSVLHLAIRQLTTPLDIQNEIIITSSVHLLHRLLCISLIIKTDKRKALSNASLAISTYVHTHNTAKVTKELTQIVLAGVFWDIGNAQCWQIIARSGSPHWFTRPAGACACPHRWGNIFITRRGLGCGSRVWTGSEIVIWAAEVGVGSQAEQFVLVVTLRCEVLSLAYATNDLASAFFDLINFLLLMLLFWLLESEIHEFRDVGKLRAYDTDLVSCA